VAPLQRKAKDSKILISFGNQDFLFSPGMQKNDKNRGSPKMAQFENLGELVKNTIFVA
jgi:hypothetical protein